jgi:hypothetical protein
MVRFLCTAAAWTAALTSLNAFTVPRDELACRTGLRRHRPRQLAVRFASSSSSSSDAVERTASPPAASAPSWGAGTLEDRVEARSLSALEGEVHRLREEARKVRHEAEQMDLALAREKLQVVEGKVSNVRWLQRQTSEQRAALEQQLQALRRKLSGDSSTTEMSHDDSPAHTSSTSSASTTRTAPPAESLVPAPSQPPRAEEKARPESRSIPVNPVNGFDPEDLDLYLPVALDIERTMANATLEAQVLAFQARPELQEHFREKIQRAILDPLEEMQELQDLRARYLDSSSDVERSQLKREMEALERSSSNDEYYEYSDTVYLSILPPLSSEALEQRKAAVMELPALLQELYRRRCGVQLDDANGDERQALELAIQLDHYEMQIDLLEQVRLIRPLSEEQRLDVLQALRSLPPDVRRFLAATAYDIENYTEDPNDTDFAELMQALEGTDSSTDSEEGESAGEAVWSSIKSLMNGDDSSSETVEYNDIDFIDRSRYVAEFYPTVAAMEPIHPSSQLAEEFCTRVLDSKRTYMAINRPERVTGGYYVRGRNLIDDDESSGSNLVERIQRKLDEAAYGHLKQQLEFFYIPDPAPLSDEQMEAGSGDQPLILLTTNNRDVLYPESSPPIKSAVCALGGCSAAIFSLIACSLQPATQERVIAAYNTGTFESIPWFWGNVAAVLGSSVAIAVLHDFAHRVVAVIDKVRIAE